MNQAVYYTNRMEQTWSLFCVRDVYTCDKQHMERHFLNVLYVSVFNQNLFPR